MPCTCICANINLLKYKLNYLAQTNIIMFVFVITSLVVKAYKETLSANDLWEHSSRMRSRRLVPRFLRVWNAEKKRVNK